MNDGIPATDTALYVLMGWQVLWQLGPLMAQVRPGTLPLLVLGGLAYSLGGVILSGISCTFGPAASATTRFGTSVWWPARPWSTPSCG